MIEELEVVQHILETHVPGCEVWAYGSRAKGQSHPYSDLDLVVLGSKSLDWQLLEKLRDAFAESDLPFRVDVTDWHSLPEGIKQEITDYHQVITPKVSSIPIIHQTLQIPCPITQAFAMFTQNTLLESWLTAKAEVESWVGGKYELFWEPDDRENNSTLGCKLLAIVPDKLLVFEWKGPPQFKEVMNNTQFLTQVMVLFFPSDCGTEIHLLHTGWRDDPLWNAARQWFDSVWCNALHVLGNQFSGIAVE